MRCICGKPMNLLWLVQWGNNPPKNEKVVLWSCPPEGCGRLYLEAKEVGIPATWYTAEKNEVKELS